MSGEMTAFFILGIIAVGGALFMLNLRKVVHMVVALAFTFLSIAGLFVLLEAEFLAVAQVLIYGGAVTIIMLFGIMLTRHDDRDETRRVGHKVLAGLVSILFFLGVIFLINSVAWPEAAGEPLFTENTGQIGIQLFSKYVIPFELTSILLLVALVGAVILAKHEPGQAKKEGDNQ